MHIRVLRADVFWQIEKAVYLFSRETVPGQGGDKQKFWREVLGFESPEVAPIGTPGAIVEVLEPGEAFFVELFGDWVTLQKSAGLTRAEADAPGAFRETLGVEVVRADQIQLVARTNPVKIDLYRLLDDMPDALLEEVQTFAEFLQHKQQATASPTPTSANH